MKMCVLAVLAYRNSFINDKVNRSNIFLACRKKKMKTEKPIKSKRKTYDLFHRKTAFQNECHAKDDIRTTLSFRCCKVVSFFQRFQQDFSFENSLLTMNNTVTKRH